MALLKAVGCALGLVLGDVWGDEVLSFDVFPIREDHEGPVYKKSTNSNFYAI
jgi:hypothetical protein